MIIDLFGLTAEEVRSKYPEVYQWVHDRVKPERDHNRRESRKKNWWIFGEPVGTFRPAFAGIKRYIVTGQVAKHRFFVFLDENILPDDKLIAITSADAYHLGVLSSRIHVCWALAVGGTLEDRPVYAKSVCFDTFPFPSTTPEQQTRIRELAEALDAHRKARQAQHPDLTLTGMYNVLQALRENRELPPAEKHIHETGLVSILRELHDDIDTAVSAAYGWPANLPDEQILSRLVALNTERASEEDHGHIRWLRPDYQTRAKAERRAAQEAFAFGPTPTAQPLRKAPRKPAWPTGKLAQTQAVREAVQALRTTGAPITAETVAQRFTWAKTKLERVQEILNALGTLGMA